MNTEQTSKNIFMYIIIIVLSIINVVYFNLSYFISYCSYHYDFCLCVACDVCHFFFLFPFLVNDLHFILALLIHAKNHFSLAIIVYIIIVIITTILFFFDTTSHWGRIQQFNSSGMVYPYPLITLGKS